MSYAAQSKSHFVVFKWTFKHLTIPFIWQERYTPFSSGNSSHTAYKINESITSKNVRTGFCLTLNVEKCAQKMAAKSLLALTLLKVKHPSNCSLLSQDISDCVLMYCINNVSAGIPKLKAIFFNADR